MIDRTEKQRVWKSKHASWGRITVAAPTSYRAWLTLRKAMYVPPYEDCSFECLGMVR